MKKITAILLTIFICAAFFGCTANNTEKSSINTTEYTLSSKSNSTNEQKTFTAEKKNTDKTNSATQNRSLSAQNTQKAKTSSIKTTTAKRSNGTTNTAKAEKKGYTSTTQAAKKPAQSSKAEKQTTTSSYITCTVTIECKSILNNMDKLKNGHEKYVPPDGYIINKYVVTLDNNSSAFDAVKAACNKQGVTINTVNSSYGKYIAGFNNIDEKDCGSQSGWVYKVNGNSPSKSCGRYKLSDGDNVVFSYTCTNK